MSNSIDYFWTTTGSSSRTGQALVANLGDRRTRNFDVVVVHGERNSQSTETPPRRWRWWKKDQRPDWIKEWLPHDAEKLGARLIDFRCRVEEKHCSNLSYHMEAQSNSLLSHIRKQRGRTGQERPIVFIAQSVGGLVVTNALARAAQADPISPTSQAIFSSTKMVIFLATPHPIVDDNRWRDRLIESLSRFGGISKNSLRSRVNDEEYETLRLQADCYRSIEARFQNVMIRESRLDTGKMPRKQRVLAHEPLKISGRPNWSVLVGTVDFDTHPDRQKGDSYQRMISWVGKSPHTETTVQPLLSLGEQSKRLDGDKMSASTETLYSEDDYKRLIVQCESRSPIAKETLAHLNSLARLYTEGGKLDEARWLHDRIQIAITNVWENSSTTVDAPTLQDILSMMRDAAGLAGRQGRYSQGVNYLESSLRLSRKASAKTDPTICRIQADLGVLYSYEGQLHKARNSYNRALQLATDCDMDPEFAQMVKLNQRLTDELLQKSTVWEARFIILSLCISVLAVLLSLWSAVSTTTALRGHSTIKWRHVWAKIDKRHGSRVEIKEDQVGLRTTRSLGL